MSHIRTTSTDGGGVVVKVTTGRPEPLPPTRYHLHLRRQAANRIRLERGDKVLPPIKRGQCGACGGWGVMGERHARCSVCGGTG